MVANSFNLAKSAVGTQASTITLRFPYIKAWQGFAKPARRASAMSRVLEQAPLSATDSPSCSASVSVRSSRSFEQGLCVRP